MESYDIQLANKIEIINIKAEVLSVLHSLQFDEVYDKENCFDDLRSIIQLLDEFEQPIRLMQAKEN